MQRNLFSIAFVAFVAGALIGVTTNTNAVAQVGVTLPAFVKLQATTPGIAQNGHSNITGTAIVGGFKMPIGADTGKVLTSDASGLGTWQSPPGLTLPFDGSYNGSQAAFQASNTGATTYAAGVVGISSGGNQAFGVVGKSTSTTGVGTGVQGECNSQGNGVTGYGVGAALSNGGYFLTSCPSGVGVSGVSQATTGANFGGYFECNSSGGSALYVVQNNSNGTQPAVRIHSSGAPSVFADGGITVVPSVFTSVKIGVGTGGVDAVNGSSTSPAIEGHNTYNGSFQSVGVTGFLDSTYSNSIAVYGYAVNGYGVFANGKFGASGTKSFRIDHPLDPENKYLMHYCAEGPEPRNVYQGHVITGGDGYAWVQLPDYYESINRDPEYNLTVLDSSDDFVLAKVTREVEGNRFQIRTSKPRVKVSWEVKGIRNDRWVQKHGAPVEVEKDSSERGKYQLPDLYGKPASMGTNNRGGAPAPKP